MEADTILTREALTGKYEILSIIGSGGMATVYKAVQISLNRLVALKVIHQNLVHDEEFVGRFLREAQVCGQLNHPNILTVFDCDSVGSIHYMSMEYLEGVTLRDMVRLNGPLNEDAVVRYIAPIASALEFIHQKEIVHRDVKSSNIMITSDGRPVLMDFGIVYTRNVESLSQYGAILGTPEYMSPEQAEGKVKVDGRSDIYSLGVIMFECLTGTLPFKSDNPLATLHQILHYDPPSLIIVNSKVPKWLSNVVGDCLIKDRNQRIQDGTLLAKILHDKKYAGSNRKLGTILTDTQVTRRVKRNFENQKILSEEGNNPANSTRVQTENRPLLITIFISLFIILTMLCVMMVNL